jgi:hypothetical protein
MVLSFLSAVCACRPSRKCVPAARPRACQGRQPRRGWSEAESLYRIAASRTLAGVVAGFVPFVSFRSGIRGRRYADALATRSRPSRSQGRTCANDCLKNGIASAAEDDRGCVFPWRAIHPRDLSSPGGHRHWCVTHRRGSLNRAGAGAGVAPAVDCGEPLGASRLPSAALRRFAVLTRPAGSLDLAITGASPP